LAQIKFLATLKKLFQKIARMIKMFIKPIQSLGAPTVLKQVQLTGQMEAVNHVSGETFAAVMCFIPEPLCSLIKTALQANEEVEFAFTVSVKRRDDLKEGYEYLVTPHKQAQEADPLAGLRQLIPQSTNKGQLSLPVSTSEEVIENDVVLSPTKKAKTK
jgi:hypothetical protein